MKRLGLVAFLVVGATVFTMAPARAGDKLSPLELANVGDEPQATGQVTYGKDTIVGHDPFGDPIWGCKVAVSCQNLTPGATYSTPVGTFTANRRGNGNVASTTYIGWGWYVYVDCLNPDGSWTTVLWGY